MKTTKEQILMDFKIQIIKNKRKFITETMDFKRRLSEAKAKLTKLQKRKSGSSHLLAKNGLFQEMVR